jgi:hypothetical protein
MDGSPGVERQNACMSSAPARASEFARLRTTCFGATIGPSTSHSLDPMHPITHCILRFACSYHCCITPHTRCILRTLCQHQCLHDMPNRYLVPAPLSARSDGPLLGGKPVCTAQTPLSASHHSSFLIPHSAFLASVSPPLSLGLSLSLFSLPSSLAMTTSAQSSTSISSGMARGTAGYSRRDTRDATTAVRTLLTALVRYRRHAKVIMDKQTELCPPEPGMKFRGTWKAESTSDADTPHICFLEKMLYCVALVRSKNLTAVHPEHDMSCYFQVMMEHCVLPGVGASDDRWMLLAFPRTGLLLVTNEGKNIMWTMTLPAPICQSCACPDCGHHPAETPLLMPATVTPPAARLVNVETNPGPAPRGFRVSLRNHSVPRINACDFYALLAFEKQHATLFEHASAPRQGGEAMSGVAVQINAFNEVFNHSQYGEELRALIDSAKRFDREYEPIVPPTTTGPRSDCAAPAPAPAAVGPVCIRCALPALPRCYSDEGRREVAISGLCEPCFDRITC